MYFEWTEAQARKNYLLKFVGTWIAAIALAAVPVMIAVNAVTL